MRRDDRNDPFDDFFRELERMMNDVMGAGGDVHFEQGGGPTGGTGGTSGTDVHLDVQETDEVVRLVADLPGVEKDSIDLKCDGTVLTIDASSDHQDFHERIRLPATVDEHSADASYNNGILEVSFERSEDARDISVS